MNKSAHILAQPEIDKSLSPPEVDAGADMLFITTSPAPNYRQSGTAKFGLPGCNSLVKLVIIENDTETLFGANRRNVVKLQKIKDQA